MTTGACCALHPRAARLVAALLDAFADDAAHEAGADAALDRIAAAATLRCTPDAMLRSADCAYLALVLAPPAGADPHLASIADAEIVRLRYLARVLHGLEGAQATVVLPYDISPR